MNKSVKEVLETVVIGRFSIPKGHQSKWFYDANERLRSVGVATYTVELAGGAVPILDLEGVTYVGEHEIGAAVEAFEAATSRRRAEQDTP